MEEIRELTKVSQRKYPNNNRKQHSLDGMGHPKPSRKHSTMISQAAREWMIRWQGETNKKIQTWNVIPQLWSNIFAWALTSGHNELWKLILIIKHNNWRRQNRLVNREGPTSQGRHSGYSAGAAILQSACFEGALQKMVRRQQS